MGDFLFYLFSGVILASGAMVVACRKPVTAAMFLLVAMAGTAAMFFLLEAFFLGILQILVYAGAVVVLFLFIIMLIDPRSERWKASRLSLGTSFLALLLLFGGVVGLLTADPSVFASGTLESTEAVGNFSKEYGYYLFSIYLLPLMLVGFMLLVAMVGVILISKRNKGADKPPAAPAIGGDRLQGGRA